MAYPVMSPTADKELHLYFANHLWIIAVKLQ